MLEQATVSILAHVDTGVVNTWGFAYVGGVIGVFSASLGYVKSKVAAGGRADRAGLASFGPVVIAVGGLCGISLGYGTASFVNSRFDDDVASIEEVIDLR